jgi:protein TonB
MVYVDGAFRYAIEPHPYNFMPPPFRKPTPASAPEAQPDAAPPKVDIGRIRQGGNVTAASLIQRVQPEYPDVARREHLAGTVRLHAIIGKDGAISKLKVMSGYCSLAEASVKAVSQWRYRPTMLMGNPVEVDTTIDVIFQLNR